MDLVKFAVEDSYFGLSQPDLLIHEILKPPRPFEYNRPNQKIPLKYKNPEVRIKVKNNIIIENFVSVKKIFRL